MSAIRPITAMSKDRYFSALLIPSMYLIGSLAFLKEDEARPWLDEFVKIFFRSKKDDGSLDFEYLLEV